MGKSSKDKVELNGEFDELEIDVDSCNLFIEYGRELSVDYSMPNAMVPEIELRNSKLTIKSKNRGFRFGVAHVIDTPKIKVVIPKDTVLEKADINVDAGNIEISELVTDKAELDVDAGNVKFSDSTFKDLKIDVDAGNIELKKCIIDKITADVNAGNIEADDCIIKGGNVETDLGNIELNGAVEDVKTRTDLGNVEINGK
ncbi:MAG: DUF4097 domain-containing protein [Lachnospiraceae bacterium]|nr:DUF4097 domain-containing protein [Lachnospiraceae bacterium]